MKNIKEIAAEHNLSVRQLGIRYGIPQRTIEDWSAERRKPPEYVINLLKKCLEYERNTKMYKIKEIETNVTYDDIYASIEEAEEQIAEYVKDDGDERRITYVVIEY